MLPSSLSRFRFSLGQGKGKGVLVESQEVLSWRESFYLFKSILHYFSRENRLSSPICAPLRIRGKKSHKNHRQHRSWLKCAATWLTYTHRGIDTCVCTQIRTHTHTRTRRCVCEACCALVTKPRCLRVDTLTNEHLIRYTNCKCVLDSFPIWYYRYFLVLRAIDCSYYRSFQ